MYIKNVVSSRFDNRSANTAKLILLNTNLPYYMFERHGQHMDFASSRRGVFELIKLCIFFYVLVNFTIHAYNL